MPETVGNVVLNVGLAMKRSRWKVDMRIPLGPPPLSAWNILRVKFVYTYGRS